jgi:perosamine synthetase
MDRLNEIAGRHNLMVIEDCAEAHGATCRDKVVGGLGDMGCFSFYANKIITTGEGGMITTNSATLAERLRLLRNLAFTQPRFRHDEPGYNFRMTGFQAAMGVSQFKKIERVLCQKARVAETYSAALADVPGLQLPPQMAWARNVYWMYGIVVGQEFGSSRDELMSRLRKDGIDTRTFFCPMNQQPFLRSQAGYRDVQCPVADRLWETGLYLPSSVTLTQEQIGHIARAVRRASHLGS